MPHAISNSGYYVSGALIVLVCVQFVNAQNFSGYQTSRFGLTPEEEEQFISETNTLTFNPPEKVIMITIMAMSSSGLTFIAMVNWFTAIADSNNFTCFYITNAMLSGAVSISAACDHIEVWHAVIIALLGTFFYSLGSKLLLRFEVDDPQEAFLIFGVQGYWAALAVGFFDKNTGLISMNSAKQLLIQFLGASCLVLWTIFISIAFFTILKRHRRFRVGNIYEVVGLDQLTRTSDFDDLISTETISKIEIRQRVDESSKKKTI